MAILTVGFKVGGYSEVGFDQTVESGNVAMYNANSYSGNLAEVYGHLKNSITAGARPILVGGDKDTDEFKVLSALMVAYNCYDIYAVSEGQLSSREYLDELAERQATAAEAEEYIDSSLASYNDLVKLLLRLKEAVMGGDQDGVSKLVTDHQAAIAGAASLVDSLKHWADLANSGTSASVSKELSEARASLGSIQTELDNAISEANAAKSKLDELSQELSSSKEKIAELESDKASLEASLAESQAQANEASSSAYTESEVEAKVTAAREQLKKEYESRIGLISGELKQSRERITSLEGQINNSGPVIKTYTEIKTSLIQCKARSVVYFKEISSVRYSPTLIMRFMEILVRMKHLKVKLVVYDNQHGFVSTYKPLPIVGFQEYLTKKENIINQVDKLVVVEPNPAIMEDILKADYDVIIVVDRLKQANDIVSGNNVYKYWLINSNNDAMAIQSQFKIDFRNVISRPGVFDEALGIEEDPDYKSRTTSSKLQAYVGMKLADGRGLMDTILARTSINTISARQRR